MEMGTRKFLTAIAVVGKLLLSNKASRVLIVGVLSILDVWEDEFSNSTLKGLPNGF